MSAIKKERGTPCYSQELIDLAYHQLFINEGIFSEDTPHLTKEEATAIQSYDNYMRAIMKKMFRTIKDSQTSETLGTLPDDFFDNYVFHVIADNTPNAFTFADGMIPDGKKHICISTGLIQLAENEDEIMGVIGHEVGHTIFDYLKTTNKNMKIQESLCDQLSIFHMQNAGYNPDYFLSMMKKLVKLNPARTLPDTIRQLADVHPMNISRIEEIEDVLAGLYENNVITKKTALPKNAAIFPPMQSLTPIINRNAQVFQTTEFQQLTTQEMYHQLDAYMQQQCITLFANPMGDHNELYDELVNNLGRFKSIMPWNNILYSRLAQQPKFEGSLTPPNIPTTSTKWEHTYYDANTQNWTHDMPDFYPEHVIEEHHHAYTWKILSSPDIGALNHGFHLLIQRIHQECGTLTNPDNIQKMAAWLKPLFENIQKETPASFNDTTITQIQHPLKLKITLFLHLLNTVYSANESLKAHNQSAIDLDSYLPTEFLEIKNLYHQALNGNRSSLNDTCTKLKAKKNFLDKFHAFTQSENTSDIKAIFSQEMQDISYRNRYNEPNVAELLFHIMMPEIKQPVVGEPMPYLDLIQYAKYEQNRRQDNQHVSNAALILRAMGIYDVQATTVSYELWGALSTSLRAGEQRYTFVNPVEFRIHENEITNEDIDTYAPYYMAYYEHTNGVTEYRYDKDTGIVLAAIEHPADPHDPKTHFEEMILSYAEDIYQQKILALNRFHYQLKEDVQTISNLTAESQKKLDALIRLTISIPSVQYHKVIESILTLNVSNSESVNSNYHNIYLLSAPTYNSRNIKAFQLYLLDKPDETIRLQYEAAHPAEQSDANQCIFRFLWNEQIADKVMEEWLQLAKEARTNAELAQRMIQLEPIWHLEKLFSSLYNFKREYLGRYLEALSHEPFSSLTYKTYDGTYPRLRKLTEQLLTKEDLMHIRETYPDVLRKIFFDYPPVTSVETLNIAPYDQSSHPDVTRGLWGNKLYLYKPVSYDKVTMYDAQQVEIAYWLTHGNTYVPAELLLTHPQLYTDNPTSDVAQQYCLNLQNRNCWPQSIINSIRVLAYGILSEEVRIKKDGKPTQLFDCVPNIMMEYKETLFNETNLNEKRNLLKLLWNERLTQLIPINITEEFLDMPENDEPSIWSGSVKDQVSLYQWLVFNNAFCMNIPLQRKILTQLIEKIKTLPVHEREELSFSLMGIRSTTHIRNSDVLEPKDKYLFSKESALYSSSGIEFPSLEEVLRKIWVDSVAEIMGGPDDSSAAYMLRIQPYIQKLNNFQSCVYIQQKHLLRADTNEPFVRKYIKYDLTTPYTQLPSVLKERLSTQLQERLLSQEKLSTTLDSSIDASGKLDNDNVSNTIGTGMDFFMFLINDSEMAENTINYLLGELTPENTQNYVESIQSNLQTRIHQNIPEWLERDSLEKIISTENTQNLQNLATLWHDQFWDKPIGIRAALLKTLYKFQYPNQTTETIVSHMINRLFAKTNYSTHHAETDIFKRFLHIFALSVPEQKKDYLPLMLLGGCLGARKEIAGEEFNLPEACRIFLEAQGAGGIKMGQMLAKQNEVPKEYQDEFIKLTNHTETPSRAEVFRILNSCFPNAANIIHQRGGLGKLLGAASHFMTFRVNQKDSNGKPIVLSLSKNHSNLAAQRFYDRVQLALETLISSAETTEKEVEMLTIVLDAVKHVSSMNNIELDGNITIQQYFWFKEVYDGITTETPNAKIEFKVVPFIIDENETYTSMNLKNNGLNAYKFTELANGVDYTLIDKENLTPEELDELQEAGFPTNNEQRKELKKSLATANCFVQMQAILTGGRFDDDRHQGQIKIERIDDINGKPNYHVHMFDVGSTSREKPSQTDLQVLGRILYKTITGMTILSSPKTLDEKRDALKEIFSNNETINQLLEINEVEESNNSNRFISLFNKALKEIKTTDIIQMEYNGETPPYIAKVERALINLTHFFNDISDSDMKSVVLNILNNKDIIHSEIIAGMEAEASPVVTHVFRNMMQNVRVSDFVETKSDEKEITKAFNKILALSQLTDDERKLVYTSFAQLYYQKDLTSDTLRQWVQTLPSDKIRNEITDNVISVLLTTVRVLNGTSANQLESNAESGKIAAGITTALQETGLPPELLNALREETLKIQPLSRRFLEMAKLTIAFPFGKLTFPVKSKIQSAIMQQAAPFIPQVREFQQNLKEWMNNFTAQSATHGVIDIDVPDREWKLEDPFNLQGDTALQLLSDSLATKTEVHRRNNMARTTQKEIESGITASIHRQQAKVEKYLRKRKALLKKIDYLKKQIQIATDTEKAALEQALKQHEKQCTILTAEYNRDIKILGNINIETAATQQSEIRNQRAIAMQDTPQAKINTYLQAKEDQRKRTALIREIRACTVLKNGLGDIGKAFKVVAPIYLGRKSNKIPKSILNNEWCLRVIGYMECIRKNNNLSCEEALLLTFNHFVETAEIKPRELETENTGTQDRPVETERDVQERKELVVANLIGMSVSKLTDSWQKLQKDGFNYLMSLDKRQKGLPTQPAHQSR